MSNEEAITSTLSFSNLLISPVRVEQKCKIPFASKVGEQMLVLQSSIFSISGKTKLFHWMTKKFRTRLYESDS
jgi:hypothetical protein